MKTICSIFITILSLLVFSGCGGNDHEKAKINYGMSSYEKKSAVCDSTGCAKIVLVYPEIKRAFNEAAKDSLMNYIKSALLDNYFQQKRTKSLDEMTELFLKDYENTRTEFVDYSLPWEINSTVSVIYNASSIVSFQSEFYHFTGGAHGMSGIYFANFNSQDGKRLTLSDLLVSGFEKELNRIADKLFRKDKDLSPDANLDEAGFWFEGNKFSLNGNFGIKNHGLVFYFNSYEIAPYAMGPTEIIVPYKEIKSLVKSDGLLRKVIVELN